MTPMELVLVGILVTIFAGLVVAACVMAVITLRKVGTSIEANTKAILALVPMLSGSEQVGDAVKLVSVNFPPMLARLTEIAKLLAVFNKLVFNTAEGTGPTELPTIPARPGLGRMFSAAPADEESSFTPYDEQAAIRRDQLAQAKAKGSNVSDEYPNPPKLEQMVSENTAPATPLKPEDNPFTSPVAQGQY